jgi:16S rRNA (guanine966-N2)-methyltransferase
MTCRPPIWSEGDQPVTRIISGLAGGRRIATPPGSSTRPTSDRVREALFSRLEHLDVVHDANVLDLYAGSGALGLEAASRGAASVLLVESDRAAVAVVRKNISDLSLPGVSVQANTVERALLAGPGTGSVRRERFDLVLADPPYAVTEAALGVVLELLVTGGWLSEDAFVMVERSARSPEPRWPERLERAGERRYGDTKVWFADFAGPPGVA